MDLRSIVAYVESLEDPELLELAYVSDDPDARAERLDEEMIEMARRLPLVETTARQELRRRDYRLSDDGELRISYGGERIEPPGETDVKR